MSPFVVQSTYAEIIRLTVTGFLSLGITAAAVYEQLVHPEVNSPLIGWAGTIVGVFIGHQVAQQSANRATVAAIATQSETKQPDRSGAA